MCRVASLNAFFYLKICFKSGIAKKMLYIWLFRPADDVPAVTSSFVALFAEALFKKAPFKEKIKRAKDSKEAPARNEEARGMMKWKKNRAVLSFSAARPE